jgi:hypothetical protein
MQEDPLAALREDDTTWVKSQKGLSAILGLWRARPDVAPVMADLERFGDGAPLEACPQLAALFDGEHAQALSFATGLVETGLTGLAAHPLGQMPLRHAVTRAAHTLLLAHSGGATLALAVFDGHALSTLPAPTSAEFAPVESWSHVLAGKGVADMMHCTAMSGERVELQSDSINLQPGTMLHRYGRHQSLQVRTADGCLVMLRLQRFLAAQEPVREHGLVDGALLYQAAARPRDSRFELAMAVLGRMGRRDAVPAMSRIATGSGHEGLRWQALRELLALDTRAGMVLLAQVAASEDEPLAGPAQELRESLLAAWPELERVAQWRG